MSTMPCPRRICFVRWLAAARKTSGAEECEYSSRKWCSTSHGVLDTEAVGELHLFERLLDEAPLAVVVPGTGKLVLAAGGRGDGLSSVAGGHRLPVRGVVRPGTEEGMAPPPEPRCKPPRTA
jgi:hypothetical protein